MLCLKDGVGSGVMCPKNERAISVWRGWLIRNEGWIAGALLLLAVTVRLVALTQLPADLNQDEASSGYEAWALLNYGIDRCGNPWPVLFVSWGSGQNVLYSVLDMPFILLFGLNLFSLRLPAALLGVVAVVVFWRLARRCRGPVCGLCALLLIAINPWHIMASRWALESNIMPVFLLLGLFCTVKAEENIRWLLGAAVSFALALYAYGTAFFFLPIFLVSYVLLNRRLLREKTFYFAGILFGLLSLPIALCQLINLVGGDGVTILGITIPKLTQARQAAVSVFGTGLSGIAENIWDFLRLLVRQSDGLDYNALPPSGLYYFFGLPLAAAGLCRSIKERRRHKNEMSLRLALLTACLCACLISININRINMAWLPLLYFQSVGLDWLGGHLTVKGSAILAVGITLCFALFLTSYVKKMETTSNINGLNEAIAFAETETKGDIYITDDLPAPYIYVLFFRQISPVEFSDTAVYDYPAAAFRNVTQFGRYRFDEKSDAECFVLTKRELFDLAGGEYLWIGEFGNYVVCLPAMREGIS